MVSSLKQEYDFFRDAVCIFSGSLILSEVMRKAFDFLSHHFPMEGLSLLKLDPESSSMRHLFLVTKDDFFYLNKLVQWPKEVIRQIKKQEDTIKVANMASNIDPFHGLPLKPYLPDKDRARLVAILSTPEQIVGHFSLIGTDDNCFTKEHESKLQILWPVLGLFMMNLGQFHEIDELRNKLTERYHYLSGRLRDLNHNFIIGEDSGLKEVKEAISQLNSQDMPVLISGETGTGKELIADAIQSISTRYDDPYIKVNCGAIPETLIDSELFGHEKGAFTSADRRRYGRFEQADGGTLFLDEIGDMPFNAQIRLLRVLQDGVFERVGGTSSIRVNVRIIAATHQDLPKMVKQGKFREDLYFRLNIFPIHVPPLRDRNQDIPALVDHFISHKAEQFRLTKIPKVAIEALPKLMSYSWPGNVRELGNLIERVFAIDKKGPLKLHLYLPEHELRSDSDIGGWKSSLSDPLDSDNKMHSFTPSFPAPFESGAKSIEKIKASMPTLDKVIEKYVRYALAICNGRIAGPKGAAKILGMHPNTLRSRMNKQKMPFRRTDF